MIRQPKTLFCSGWRASLMVVLLSTSVSSWAQWPTIRPASGSVNFRDASVAEFTTAILGTAGEKVRYVLRCRNGNLDDDPDFNYSGLFHCRLFEPNADRRASHSLLFEDRHATSDWDGRGRFLLSEVVGACANYPDWGSRRTYLVRGMKLVLVIDDVNWIAGDPPIVKSFRFSYKVEVFPAARSALTRRSPVKEPTWFGGSKDDCLMRPPGPFAR